MKRHRFTNIRGHAVIAGCDSGGPYASALERDNFITIVTDHTVKCIRLQKPQATYLDERGKPRRYTADAEVEFHDANRPKLAIECKYTAELLSEPDLIKKFDLVKAAMVNSGHTFELRTEKDIRTPDFRWRRFVFNYINNEPHANAAGIVSFVRSRSGIRLGDVIGSLGDDRISRLELVAEVWRLVARGQLMIEYGARPSVDTAIYSIGQHN